MSGYNWDWERIKGIVVQEAEQAQYQYGDFASHHEAYGVLAEEVDELFDAIRLKQSDPTRAPSIDREAIQIAAVALRLAEQARRLTR